MQFEIKNLGQINSANLKIDKINVVSGKNDRGKSNLGKAIYCFLAPASKDKDMITQEHIYKELLHIIIHYEVAQSKKIEECHELLYHDRNQECLELFRKIIKEDPNIDQEYYDEKLSRIEKLFHETGEEQYLSNLRFLLHEEYCYYYGLFKDSEIHYENNAEKILLEKNCEIKNCIGDNDIENIIYMNIESFEQGYHNKHVRKKCYYFNKQDDEDFIKITEKLEKIIKHCRICGLSAGIKQLNNLKSLLESGEISRNSILILDNPENDLHPTLQVKFSEILVLIGLKLDISVYINTNSPFIAESIEAYSKFYNIYKETNFYHLEKDENTEDYNLKLLDDITISEIYNEFEEAFEMIKNVQTKIPLGVNEGYF